MKRTRRINRRKYYVRIPWNNWKSSISLLKFMGKEPIECGTFFYEKYCYLRGKKEQRQKKRKSINWIEWFYDEFNEKWFVTSMKMKEKCNLSNWNAAFIYICPSRANSMELIPLLGINLKLNHKWCTDDIRL